MNESFLENLNDSQRIAVEYCDGPSLVIAGAGSGKTRVLTYKIAYLLSHGVKPWDILALTFTNKAANEMKSRIGNLVGNEFSRYLNMGTFHSVFSRILRVEHESTGYNTNFTIYDESDSRSLLKSIIKEMKLDDKIYKPAGVHSRISMAKNHLVLPSDYANNGNLIKRDSDARMPAMSRIYTTYCERCRKANAMDFDDLLTCTYLLFRDHPDVRAKYADRFKFVLVDEYQDTNSVQQQIVYLITKDAQRICVVGDDAQSIYGFRGANIDNILNFRQMYNNVQLFKLEQNYRSTQRIVQAANSLIKHNERQIPKDVYSKNSEGDKLILHPAYSDKEEAIIVCNEIKKIRLKDKCEYSDFAILYRTNSQSRSFEEAMRKENIPYRIYGGLSFYQRKEIKDIIAYFRLVANIDDEEAFKRIINYPARGIGDTTLAKITDSAEKNGVSLWNVISNPEQYSLNVNKGTLTKLANFRLLINGYVEKFFTEDAYELGKEIIQSSGISSDIFSDTTPEGISRQENIEEFLNGMQDFVEGRREEDMGDHVSLSDFLQEVSLLTDLDSEGGDDIKRVTLMTIHSAKGLEFPTVFVVGLEENIFPSPMCTENKRELEEERRLLYVAITRAEKHCILTCAKNRFRYGKMEYDTPSRFINDIDPNLIIIKDESSFGTSESEIWGIRKEHKSHFNEPVLFGNDNYRGYDDTDKKRNVEKKDFSSRTLTPGQPSANGHFTNVKKLNQQSANQSANHTYPKNTTSNDVLQAGCVIEHDRFGVGHVLRVEGAGENTKATVEFTNVGTKQLLLKFARYKIIG